MDVGGPELDETWSPGGTRRIASLRVVMQDTLEAHSLASSGPLTVGRAATESIVVSHESVSRQHVRLDMTHGHVRLCDAGSSNGTRVRGVRLGTDQWVEIAAGDIATLGEVSLFFHDGEVHELAARTMGRDALASCIAAAIAEHATKGIPFAVCAVRCMASNQWPQAVHGFLLKDDVLTALSDVRVAVVLKNRSARAARRWASDVENHLRLIGTRIDVRLAMCPDTATTTAGLMGMMPSETPTVSTTRRPPPRPTSQSMRVLDEFVHQIASSPTSVLILGETGVGKEVMARSLHDRSARSRAAFMALSCAALPETLLEGELFGYQKGAFTGATTSKAGLFELAHGGTLFLDEIGELPPSTQAKLLRVLEERVVRRLGATKAKPIDVRLLAATNRDLPAEIAAGRFRADLYYRINAISVSIPPLRDRVDEILPLAEHFCALAASALRRRTPFLTTEAGRLLLAWRWPGNVRELRNAIERATLLARDGIIEPSHLPDEIRSGGELGGSRRLFSDNIEMPSDAFGLAGHRSSIRPAPSPSIPSIRASCIPRPELPTLSSEVEVPRESMPPSLLDEMQTLERARIMEALAQCNGNQSKAARVLGITRRVLLIRLERYGLRRKEAR